MNIIPIILIVWKNVRAQRPTDVLPVPVEVCIDSSLLTSEFLIFKSTVLSTLHTYTLKYYV